MIQIPFGTHSFADNPEPRVPCVLVLDVSGSMDGQPIQELNEGIRQYKDELASDSIASKRVEIAIVTFGEDVRTVVDFTTAEGFEPPVLGAAGMTPMGQAVDQAIDMVEARKQVYKANGIAYYRPWIFLITDGGPNDANWERAAERAVLGDRSKSFAFFGVGIGEADMATLQRFCVREPLKMKGIKFRELFQWLSSSQKSVSRSTPGEEVPLQNPAAPQGWAFIS
jgi:uncharacterized protein YegL